MKNRKIKLAVTALSICIGASPILACGTAPRANTTGSTQICQATTTSETAKPSTETTPPTPQATTPQATTPEKTEENNTPENAKKLEDAKKEDAKKLEKKEDTKKDDAKKSEKKEKADSEVFSIDNFKVIQTSLEKLGVTPEELETKIKEGKKLIDVLEESEIPVKKFKKTLYKEYCKVIKEGVKSEKITKEEGKALKAAIKQKVELWMSEKEDAKEESKTDKKNEDKK
ncbi:MAG: hypothetical protein ATN32_06630 [Candidatus Epulonipiscium fishelsonii]|nr:MAG: hypothetical protein ATN32_06630 [Epulopiscium sp. AS2M-Bin002]